MRSWESRCPPRAKKILKKKTLYGDRNEWHGCVTGAAPVRDELHAYLLEPVVAFAIQNENDDLCTQSWWTEKITVAPLPYTELAADGVRHTDRSSNERRD